MTERLVISVDPGQVEQSQKVQDVFAHVLDLFELLSHSGVADDSVIGWRLVRVSMNSPLTIEAEAIVTKAPPANFDIEAAARRQSRTFARNVSELKLGRVPDAWRGAKEIQRVRRAFNTARNAALKIEIPKSPLNPGPERTEVVPADLVAVQRALAAVDADTLIRPKTQRGSLEGKLVEVAQYYHKPAIKLLERKTGVEVWCVVTEEHRAEIASGASFDDVWSGRRVRVEGALYYDESGSITRVVADSVILLAEKDIPANRIFDPDATQGMTSLEYLERFREGTLG